MKSNLLLPEPKQQDIDQDRIELCEKTLSGYWYGLCCLESPNFYQMHWLGKLHFDPYLGAIQGTGETYCDDYTFSKPASWKGAFSFDMKQAILESVEDSERYKLRFKSDHLTLLGTGKVGSISLIKISEEIYHEKKQAFAPSIAIPNNTNTFSLDNSTLHDILLQLFSDADRASAYEQLFQEHAIDKEAFLLMGETDFRLLDIAEEDIATLMSVNDKITNK